MVHDATLGLATPGRRIRSAGSGLAGRLRDAGSAIDDVPLVGDKVRSPFDGAGRAADQIAQAGTSQVEAVQHLASWRAMSHQPLERLAAISSDPVRAWRDGDPDAVRRLALLELRDAGLTAPATR